MYKNDVKLNVNGKILGSHEKLIWKLDAYLNRIRGLRGRDRMVVGTMQSVSITHGEVYSMQHCVINFVSDMHQVGGFLRILRFPPRIKRTTTI